MNDTTSTFIFPPKIAPKSLLVAPISSPRKLKKRDKKMNTQTTPKVLPTRPSKNHLTATTSIKNKDKSKSRSRTKPKTELLGVAKKLREAEDFPATLTDTCFAMLDAVDTGSIDADELMGTVCDVGEERGLKRTDTAKLFKDGLLSVREFRKKNGVNAKSHESKPASNPDFKSAYERRDTGLYHRRGVGDSSIDVALTNFTAEITSDVIEDDGEQTKRFFEIETKLHGRKSQLLIAADDFSSMKWVTEKLGSQAVIHPRLNDYARCAMQLLSPSPKERRIFTHTGWRELDGEFCYLHGGGAIGKDATRDVEIRLPDSLAPMELPVPPKAKEWREAMAKVFDLMNLAPDEIIIPAVGAAWSSVIGHADFSIWLYGTTGSGKSQIAALIQSFFGNFNADKLPGSWMSTANALEGIAHSAKDMIFVVDDFKPTGSAQDRARLHRDADRLLRAQGNQAGRQRLTADTTQRKTKYPRGLIFNTAEEVPQGESLVARLLVLEMQKSSVDFTQLSALQELSSDGLFALAMSGFIQWLATHHVEVLQNAKQEIAKRRDEWARRSITAHRRFATTLAHLEYSWSLWIRAAQDSNLLNASAAQKFQDRVLSALSIAGGKQDGHTDTQNPVTRFLELLGSALNSQSAYLEHRNGGMPSDPTMCGWRKINDHYEPKGDRIGWTNSDDDELFLIPDATYRVIERHASHGVGVGVQAATLWKQLFEAGIITVKEEKGGRRGYSIRRKIEGQTIPVLVFSAQKTLGYTENDEG